MSLEELLRTSAVDAVARRRSGRELGIVRMTDAGVEILHPMQHQDRQEHFFAPQRMLGRRLGERRLGVRRTRARDRPSSSTSPPQRIFAPPSRKPLDVADRYLRCALR